MNNNNDNNNNDRYSINHFAKKTLEILEHHYKNNALKPCLSDLFKEYIILENTTCSVLNLNKLMSRMYTTYICFKNLLFSHP